MAIFLIILETARGQVNIILAVVPEDLLLMLVCIVDCNYIDQVPLGGVDVLRPNFMYKLALFNTVHLFVVWCLAHAQNVHYSTFIKYTRDTFLSLSSFSFASFLSYMQTTEHCSHDLFALLLGFSDGPSIVQTPHLELRGALGSGL